MRVQIFHSFKMFSKNQVSIFCNIFGFRKATNRNSDFFHKSLTSCTSLWIKAQQHLLSYWNVAMWPNQNCRNQSKNFVARCRQPAPFCVRKTRTHPFSTHVRSRFSTRLVNNLCDRHTERERDTAALINKMQHSLQVLSAWWNCRVFFWLKGSEPINKISSSTGALALQEWER
jgi:hypothetical protein